MNFYLPLFIMGVFGFVAIWLADIFYYLLINHNSTVPTVNYFIGLMVFAIGGKVFPLLKFKRSLYV